MNETITSQTEVHPTVSDSHHAGSGTANCFTPLHCDDPHCVIGYPCNASTPDLYEAATLRQSALLGLLCALSSAQDLQELSTSNLQDCIQAIRILSEDAAALYTGAWQALQNGRN